MQGGNDVSEEIVLCAGERVERNMNLDCKCSFITFYTDVPFQYLANEFELLFMRAFFPVIVAFILYSDQENSVYHQVNGHALSIHFSDCNNSFLTLKF